MLFPLEEQIRSRATQIDNLRTPIAILLQAGTLEAIKGVTNPFPATDDAFVLVVAERAFVADAYEGGGPHVGVTDGTFAVTFVAEAADGDAGLLAAHYEIGVVTRHLRGCKFLLPAAGVPNYEELLVWSMGK